MYTNSRDVNTEILSNYNFSKDWFPQHSLLLLSWSASLNTFACHAHSKMFTHNHLSVILKWDKSGDNARPSFTSKVPRNYNLGSLLTLTLVLQHYQLKMSYQGKLCSATTRLRRTRLAAAMTKAAKQIPKYTANPTFTAIHLPFSLWPCHPPRADSVTEAPI